jgi:hypothetical protein
VVDTPNVLTKDGSQVHSREYEETREIVLTGITRGALPSLEPELDVCQTGLRFAPLQLAQQPSPPFDGGFSITTQLDRDGVTGVLPLLGFHRVREAPDGGRWILGLQAARESSYADLAIHDDGARRRLDFTVHVASDPNHAIAFTAMAQAKQFAILALVLVKQHDPNVTRDGGDGLFNGD